MSQQQNATLTKFLFAARREKLSDGTSYLILQSLKSKQCFCEKEEKLRNVGIELGDFLVGKAEQLRLLLQTVTKTEHKEKFKVTVSGDVSYIEDVRVTLIPAKDKWAFRNDHFANALVRETLPEGDYLVRISRMIKPEDHSGIEYFLEATDPVRLNNEPETVIIGKGFSESTSAPINGSGFTTNSETLITMKAVVLGFTENDGLRTHFLWLLDKHTEGRLITTDHRLESGHFFEGKYKERQGLWQCQTYQKPLETLIPGGLESGRIYFVVKLTEYRPTRGNQMFAVASAEYFDEIFDNESKLSADCVGTHVKIQRHAIAEKDYAWVVVEVL